MDRKKCFHTIREQVLSLGEKKCTVYLLHGDFSDAEMHGLYNNPKVSCLLSLTHGEGFGLPIFEAAYSGIPVVATGWSGQLDFLVDEAGKDNFYNVAYDIAPVPDEVVWDGVLIKESMWAFPREASSKQQMRACYNDIKNSVKDSIAINSCNYAKEVHERFSEKNQNASFINSLMDFVQTKEEEEWRDILDQVVEYD